MLQPHERIRAGAGDIEQEVLAQLNFGFLRYLSSLNSNSRPTYLSFLTPTNQ